MDGLETDMIMLITTPTCAGCKTAKPIYEDFFLAKQQEYSIVDGSVEKDLMLILNVRSVPTLLFIKDRKVTGRIVGVPDTDKLKTLYKEYLGENDE